MKEKDSPLPIKSVQLPVKINYRRNQNLKFQSFEAYDTVTDLGKL